MEDYTNCGEVRRGFLQGTPKVRCPKCNYTGQGKRKGFFSKSYVCPRCGNGYLEKTGHKTGCLVWLLAIVGFYLLLAFVSRDGDRYEQRIIERQANSTNVVRDKVEELKNMYLDKEGLGYVPEFQGMKCADEKCKEVFIYYHSEPSEGALESARTHAINLSMIGGWGVQVLVFINGDLKYNCSAYKGELAGSCDYYK